MSVFACLVLPNGAVHLCRSRTCRNRKRLCICLSGAVPNQASTKELCPSAQGKEKCHSARGLFDCFEGAGPVARPFYRMKSLRPMRFFEINRPATDLKRGSAGAAEN